MTDKYLLSLYGLKFNPFLQNLPVEALWTIPGIEIFEKRLETLAYRGGFALITGEPGLGKSKTLQRLSNRLGKLPEISVGVMERPQSRGGDFYRELGDLFGVNLSPSNRYGSFKSLRARWRSHCDQTLFRPVLFIDEAQEVSTECLTELRILTSAKFDSECLLTTVLCGDSLLTDRLRTRNLLPLGSRIRTRLNLTVLDPEDLVSCLNFLLTQAGAPQLMSNQLIHILAEHSLGNLRVLTQTAEELLAAAAERELPQLDENLYLEIFSPNRKSRNNTTKRG